MWKSGVNSNSYFFLFFVFLYFVLLLYTKKDGEKTFTKKILKVSSVAKGPYFSVKWPDAVSFFCLLNTCVFSCFMCVLHVFSLCFCVILSFCAFVCSCDAEASSLYIVLSPFIPYYSFPFYYYFFSILFLFFFSPFFFLSFFSFPFFPFSLFSFFLWNIKLKT